MRGGLVLVIAAVLAIASLGCGKRQPPAPNAAFDQRWARLAAAGGEPLYVQDDRGQALMGSVLGAQAGAVDMAALLAQSFKGGTRPTALPDQPDPTEVQRLVRRYLPGVKSCYQQLSRAGDGRSGKAIVTFQIASSGHVQAPAVDAPAFDGTPLPACIGGQVSHWVFPPSRKGGPALSYPFVFVGE
jgi:hypothetical protein